MSNEPPHVAGDTFKWEQAASDRGLKVRRAARVLLVDEFDRVLLAKGHDADRPSRKWWFTVGGGIDPGESPAGAALRELYEETGIRLDPATLVGPVVRRTDIFDFETEHILQREVFFFARISGAPPLSRVGWTDVENSFLEEMAWLSVTDIAASQIEVFPANLAQVVTRLLAGWDGSVIDLGLADRGLDD